MGSSISTILSIGSNIIFFCLYLKVRYLSMCIYSSVTESINTMLNNRVFLGTKFFCLPCAICFPFCSTQCHSLMFYICVICANRWCSTGISLSSN